MQTGRQRTPSPCVQVSGSLHDAAARIASVVAIHPVSALPSIRTAILPCNAPLPLVHGRITLCGRVAV